eukprot:CAMPEP_0202958116 /NCGR_PEP_ID=MMETSP1396-20130829/2465_1 /ASSEMBLY_ACC=CAM_ASM_000872 /TAXON_ID= /ORGANISM="Pseudokeronopsis sp., Strain Brazil" /LENGTH=122 /DNA_ID=CAMNT_0049675981 /DNA_START=197 /DNA_END=565 /DNA_ORIENTATION=+
MQGLEERLGQLAHSSEEKEQLALLFDRIVLDFHQERDFIASVAFCVPAYLLANFQAQLDQFNYKLVYEKEKAIPKKKFAFVRKPAPKKEKEAVLVEHSTISNNALGNHFSLKNLYNQNIKVT